jgi:hypothetical protein
VKTNQENYTEIILKKMDADYVDSDIVYKNTYSDVYYNLEINNIAETISHMIAGKYEISTTSTLFELESIELADNEYVSLAEENGKYYVIIEETPNDSYGLLTINLSEKEHKGYQTEADIEDNNKANNFWKTTVQISAETTTKAKMSRRIIAPAVTEEPEETSETEISNTEELIEEELKETSEDVETVQDDSQQ